MIHNQHIFTIADALGDPGWDAFIEGKAEEYGA